MESISGMESSAPRPHYRSETVASTLPPYFHGETERITNAFRSGSCWSVKQLPHVLQYGEVQKKRHANTTNNLLQKPPRIYKAVVVKKHFWNIPYVPTTYDKFHILEKSAFEVDRNQIESTGRKAGLVIPSRIRAKYEDIFEDINYQYPTSVLGPAVGVPKLETIVREEFSDMRRFTCGARKSTVLNRKVPENELGVEWTKKVFGLLARDWAQLKFTVKFTQSDELLVQFEMTVNSSGIPIVGSALLASLGKYMNTLVTHGAAAEFGLRKRGDRWGQLEQPPEERKTMRKMGLDENGNSDGFISPRSSPKSKCQDASPVPSNRTGATSNTADSSSGRPSHQLSTTAADEGNLMPTESDEMDLIDSPIKEPVGWQNDNDFSAMQGAEEGRSVSFDVSPNSKSAVATTNGAQNNVRFLTYSMYAPWVSVGSLNATRAAAFAGRQAARRKLEEEKEALRQERLQKLSLLAPDENSTNVSVEAAKQDPKLLHIAMHGLRKSAKDFLFSRRSRSRSPPNGAANLNGTM